MLKQWRDKSWGKRMVLCILSLQLLILFSGCGRQPANIPENWGRAEAKEIDVNTKIAGRVVSLLVKEGDVVQQGQLIARIDNRDISAKADQARASIQSLQAQVSQANTVTGLQDRTSQASLSTAKAQVEKSRSDLAVAETDFIRYQGLLQTGAVSQQVFDNMKLKYQVAQATYSQALAAQEAAEAGLMQTQINLDNEAAVQNKLVQAQAALAEVEVYLDETEIRAPMNGIVTAKYVEQGEMVSTGTPLVAVQDPKDNWVNLKVRETELSKYHLQDEVTLEGREPGLRLTGKIVDISKKAEFATYRSTNERGENDVITFNVKIRVDSEQVRPGMRFRILQGDR